MFPVFATVWSGPQDGCSLALCTSSAKPMVAPPLYFTHTDFPACLPQVSAGDCSHQTGGQGANPSPGFPSNQ